MFPSIRAAIVQAEQSATLEEALAMTTARAEAAADNDDAEPAAEADDPRHEESVHAD